MGMLWDRQIRKLWALLTIAMFLKVCSHSSLDSSAGFGSSYFGALKGLAGLEVATGI